MSTYGLRNLKKLKKKLTFYVPEDEKGKAWAFLNKYFRDEHGNPKYFDYLSVREGNGVVTVTIYKKNPVEYILFKLYPEWYKHPKTVRGMIHQTWRKLRHEQGYYGYP
jgi:hypothetical protein